jgi:hypothetical protein
MLLMLFREDGSMSRYRGLGFLCLTAGLIGLAGCGNQPKYARVSGVVRIDGVPYDKGVVSFQPKGTKENPNPGRGSSAYTDAQGRFEMACDMDRDGAVVGTHLVRIMTKGGNVLNFDPAIGSPDQVPANMRNFVSDPIPAEWNATSVVEFTVPPGGTDQANFDITSRTPKKRK